MTEAVSRATVERFYQAYDSRDVDSIAACLDDDVEWDVFGPATVMLICGQWRGKAAVVDRFSRVVSKVVKFRKFERSYVLVDGDQSAACGHITSEHVPTGRIIRHRVAHFVRYRAGKVISFRVVADTLDAAEQFIGQRIDLGTAAGHNGDLLLV